MQKEGFENIDLVVESRPCQITTNVDSAKCAMLLKTYKLGKIQLHVLKNKIVQMPKYQHLSDHIDNILKEKNNFKTCFLHFDGLKEVSKSNKSEIYKRKNLNETTEYNLEDMKGYCFVDSFSVNDIMSKYDKLIDKQSIKEVYNLKEKDDKYQKKYTVFKLRNTVGKNDLSKMCRKKIINLDNKTRFLKIECDYEHDQIIFQHFSIVSFDKALNQFQVNETETDVHDLNTKCFGFIYNNNKSILKSPSVFQTVIYTFLFNICNNVEKYKMNNFDFSFDHFNIDKVVIKNHIDLIKDTDENDVSKLLNLTINASEQNRQNINAEMQQFNFTYNNLVLSEQNKKEKCKDQEDAEKCIEDMKYNVKMTNISMSELEEDKQKNEKLRNECVDTKLNMMNSIITLKQINKMLKGKTLSYEIYSPYVSNDDSIYIQL